MIYNLINYSLEQKLYNYSLKKIENNILEITFKDDKFIIYHSNIQGPVNHRPHSERRIQTSPKLKEKLHSFMGEDYKIILLGYDKITNTFSFWKYGYHINIGTTQSLPTRIQILSKAKRKGFDVHYYKNRNLGNSYVTEHSFAINAFLFPLILENYNIIFTKDISKIFTKKIQSWNNRFRKDELILCLDLYYKKFPLSKNSPEIQEISDYCKKRSDLMGFNPRDEFYQELSAKNFRNINGISKKLENIASADPINPKKNGLIPDPHAKKILEDNYIKKSNELDEQKLSQDAKEIKNKIISNKIDVLIGEAKVEDLESKINKTYNEDQPNILLDFDLNKSYTDGTFNPDNYDDPIKKFNAIDRATKLHEEVLKKLAKICKGKNLPIKKSVHIDFYTEYKNRGKLFEVKTFNNSNFKQQIRHAIVQLKEYYYVYAKFNTEILKETNLFILLNNNPEKIITKKIIGFLKDQNIILCWLQNNKIRTFNDSESTIKWLL